MKYLFLFPLLFIGLGCNTANEESEINNTEMVINSEGQSANPGEIIFKAKILEVYDSEKDMCGTSTKHVIKVEVIEILQVGSSIIHMPRKGGKILVNFAVKPKDINTNTLIEIKALEALCREASETYFTINSHKIID